MTLLEGLGTIPPAAASLESRWTAAQRGQSSTVRVDVGALATVLNGLAVLYRLADALSQLDPKGPDGTAGGVSRSPIPGTPRELDLARDGVLLVTGLHPVALASFEAICWPDGPPTGASPLPSPSGKDRTDPEGSVFHVKPDGSLTATPSE